MSEVFGRNFPILSVRIIDVQLNLHVGNNIMQVTAEHQTIISMHHSVAKSYNVNTPIQIKFLLKGKGGQVVTSYF